MRACIIPESRVGDRAIPPTKRVDEEEVEVAHEKAVLGYESLAVPHELLILDACECPDVGAIDGAKTLVEISQMDVI